MPKKNTKWLLVYEAWRLTDHGHEAFEAVKKLACDIHKLGFKHYSMQTIVCVVRHHRRIKTRDRFSDFKLNNNYSSYLARELMSLGHLPAGFFQIRENAIV